MTTVQGAAAAEINTPPVTTNNIENIGSGMDDPASKDQRSSVSQNVPINVDGLVMTSEESDINMFDTVTTASSSQQKPVSILKEPGTGTRPKFPNEPTHAAFADVPSTNEKTGLPSRGASNPVDFNTSASDTFSQDDLIVNNEKKGSNRPIHSREYKDLMRKWFRNIEYSNRENWQDLRMKRRGTEVNSRHTVSINHM